VQAPSNHDFCADKNLVIYQCGLKRDLSLFEAGDQTEVGEKAGTIFDNLVKYG
jgi:hypothetical protein